jgi:hypothetical protein
MRCAPTLFFLSKTSHHITIATNANRTSTAPHKPFETSVRSVTSCVTLCQIQTASQSSQTQLVPAQHLTIPTKTQCAQYLNGELKTTSQPPQPHFTRLKHCALSQKPHVLSVLRVTQSQNTLSQLHIHLFLLYIRQILSPPRIAHQ